MPANLQSLPGDVVFNILRYCGISDVIAVSQTCRHLHSLAFTKHVWLALLQVARSFLDQWYQSPLHQFSTEELVGLAKRMVQGPQTWSHSHSSGPLIAHQKVLHPQIYLGPGVLVWENEPKLLSGGQYVLFNSRRTLECWCVLEDRLIWTHQSQWEFANVLQFAAEVVDGGRAAVILIGQRTTSMIRKNVVEVVRLDFLSETAQPLFSTPVPDTYHDNPFVRVGICGDIAVLGVNINDQILLMNWRTQSCIMFLTSTVVYDVTLSSTHIVIIEPGASPGTCHIDVWAVQSLAEFWSPGDFTNRYEVVRTSDVPRLLRAAIQLPTAHSPRFFRLSAHDSPLREDLFVIWVYISSASQGGSDFKSTICKFSLFAPPSTSPQLRLRSSTSTEGVYPVYRDISYSGHTEIFDGVNRVQRILALPELGGIMNRRGHIIVLPDQGDPVHVSPYSGTLTYATHYSVVVNYYQ